MVFGSLGILHAFSSYAAYDGFIRRNPVVSQERSVTGLVLTARTGTGFSNPCYDSDIVTEHLSVTLFTVLIKKTKRMIGKKGVIAQ